MPASRDTDWTHVRVIGDRNAAARYLPFGRKLLGYVKQDAAHNKLQTHKVSKQLDDGALVIAEIHGMQPIITIVPPGGLALSVKEMMDRFVVFARRDGLWDGIDADRPEQWLDAPGVSRKEEDGWMARFFDAEVEGYDPFREDHGIYSVFGRVSAFPRGTRRAGNCDHRGKEGYRVSWYGPSSRVALDACIDDEAVWLDKVFIHGEELLTIPEGRVVFGAGLAGGSLFTVEGPWPTLGGYTGTPPDWDAAMHAPLPTAPYAAAGGAQLHVCRYPASGATIPGRRTKIRVDPDKREVLFAFDWQGKERYPWAFNPDCTEVSGMSTNDNGPPFASPLYGQGFFYTGMRTSNMYAPGTPPTGFRFADEDGTLSYSGPEGWFPYAADTRYTVSIAKNEAGEYSASATTETVALPAGGAGSAVVARDYDEEGNRVELLIERDTLPAVGDVPYDQPGTLFLRLGAVRMPIRECTGPSATRPYPPETATRPVPTTSRFLLHADLPQRALVIGVVKSAFEWRDSPDFSYVETRENRVEIWRNGVKLDDVLLGTTDAAVDDSIGYPLICDRLLSTYDYKTAFDAMLAVPLAPSFALYGYAFAFDRVWGSTDGNPGFSFGAYIWGALGASSSYMYSAYPAEYNFGWMQQTSGSPFKVIDYEEFIAADITLSGRYVPLWGATLGDHTLVSGPSFDNAAPLEAFTWADHGDDDRSLPDLTGVGGTHQRYHPIWRLGRFDLVQGESP